MASFANPKAQHPFHMHAMIHAQPGYVREAISRVHSEDAASFLGSPRRLILTGCGTSFHAAMYGARVLRSSIGDAVPIDARHAYDVAYGGPVPQQATVVGVSHSGSTPTTNRALARAKRAGLRTLGICGIPNTAMERVADEILVIGSTHDLSWANTMSYTTQLVAFGAIAAQLSQRLPGIEDAIRAIHRTMEKALRSESAVRRLATRVARSDRITFLGTGWDDITALEAALKIRETCSMSASGYHAEQFLHGPFLSLDRRESVVLLRSREDGKRVETIGRALAKTGAAVATIGEHPRAAIRLPRCHAFVRPVVSVIPMQFLAYHVALKRRTNPDIMRTDIPRLRAGVEALFH